MPTPYPQEESEPAAPRAISRLDPPEHTRCRRMLTGQFAVHRFKQLEPDIQEITEDHIEALRHTKARPSILLRRSRCPSRPG
ncbi:hypothetical protein [Nonomuraea diastatica]|uniref:Cytochrome P450 n=1 Tax=Nonomuraea diastatica TaxID=1848329 RepID=A0A4R4X396_9ACTN|nr:hypothetical protein [Nonomuraea diastatica]TDD24751.1 hypothetical protein E1294_04735 [Nonomuraea diastatica]